MNVFTNVSHLAVTNRDEQFWLSVIADLNRARLAITGKDKHRATKIIEGVCKQLHNRSRTWISCQYALGLIEASDVDAKNLVHAEERLVAIVQFIADNKFPKPPHLRHSK